MRIIVYEYASGGGYAEQAIPCSILAEGYAMMRCVAADLKAAGHKVTVLLDERISRLNPSTEADCTIPISSVHETNAVLSNISENCDAILMIAPETDQILQKLVKTVEETGKISLNCASDAIASISNKAELAAYLQKNGYPTPKTLVIKKSNISANLKAAIKSQLVVPLVLKPQDGTSCSAISLVKSEEKLDEAIQKIAKQSSNPQFIVQEYATGLAASVSVISNGKKAVAVSLNKQQVTLAGPEGDSSYDGGCVPLEHPLKARALSLAEHLVEAFPGLRGYVGIDVILSDNAVYVVDVNPRLTTSYLGLHASCSFNVAQALIDAVIESKLPKNCAFPSVAFFSKYQITKPTLEVFHKMAKQEAVVSPAFPLAEDCCSTALLLGKGVSMQDAYLRLEEAKKALRIIMG